MPGDDRAADRALIARRRDDDNPAAQREIKRLQKAPLPSRRRAFERDAQIDHPRPGVDDIKNCPGKLFSSGARHLLAVDRNSCKDRSNEKTAAGTNRRSRRPAPRQQNAGDEGAVSACRIAGVGARSRQVARDFTDVFGGEIRVIERDRPVDQADGDFGLAAHICHQRRESDQIQAIGTAPDLARATG